MIGGPKAARFAGAAGRALSQRQEQQDKLAAAKGNGVSAAGLADLMKAQYEQDPNNPNNVAKYYEMWDKGQGRQLTQDAQKETGRHNLAEEGLIGDRNKQIAGHENYQDALNGADRRKGTHSAKQREHCPRHQ